MRQRAPLPVVVAASVALLATGAALAGPSVEPTAVVAWPPSAGLLVGEVVTGGASGSDEFAELYNASVVAVDLGGLELVYVTSSGSTVTRKATWSGGTLLPAGSHLLVANGSGIYASIADALYSGGLAATGGALVLRPVGGSPIDAVAWGDATNGFVEGATAAAPPAGQSIERRPGGLGGNGTDTNQNAQDFIVNSTPTAQNLTAPPVPAPQPTIEVPTDTQAAPTATPGVTPTPAASPAPTDDPAPSPDPSPAPTGTPVPTATPSSEPTASPSAAPSSTPGSPIVTVADARAAPDGWEVDIAATLTSPLGLTESGTGAFVQDETGGIGLYLASADWPDVAPGTLVRVHGTVDDRYSQRIVRLSSAAEITGLGNSSLPAAVATPTGSASEALEGRLVTVVARVITSADALTDGFAVTVDDGSGELRVVATLPSGVVAADLPSQAWVQLTGPLGQRDSSGSGTQGYRLYLRSPDDIVPAAPPTPDPTVEPSATASPVPSPSSAPSPTSAPSPSPTPTSVAPMAIAAVRTLPLDSVVTVDGVVTVEPGRIIDGRSMALQDASGGIVVRLPSAGWPAFGRGDVLRVSGVLAQRYGNLEIRPPSPSAVSVRGPGALPAPRDSLASELSEALEGRLVRCTGTVVAVGSVGTTGSYPVDLQDPNGTMRVFVYGTTGIARASFAKGAIVEVTGIEGQHAPSVGSTSGHRVWPRGPADVRPATVSSPSPSSPPAPTASPWPPGRGRVPIASAILSGGAVTVEGTVTTPAGFVDSDGRRIVLEDESGALIVRLPTGTAPPPVGTRIQVSGEMGTYYGSPQLALQETPVIVSHGLVVPRVVIGQPDAGLAWRLVRVSGRVVSVHRLGATWRAELSVGSDELPLYGAARTGIPSTALVEGRSATVTGIVRPPYPTATDRRAAVAPRTAADITLGAWIGGGTAAERDGIAGAPGGSGSVAAGSAGGPVAIDIELAELGEHDGALVRVGGLVVSTTAGRVVIDDGTATAAIIVPDDAATLTTDIDRGDPLNAVGTVVRDGEGWAIAPRSAADIARVGRLGELAPLATPAASSLEDGDAVQAERLGSHGGWPFGLLPTAVALVGSALTVVLRRRAALEMAKRAGSLMGIHLGR